MELDLRSPDFQQNPYPIYAKLRRDAPVSRVEPGGFLAIARYHDVVSVLRDPKRFRSSGFEMIYSPIPEAMRPLSILVSDPPSHGRLRGLVSKAFTPEMVSGLETRIRSVCRQLIASIARGPGEFDFVKDFSVPLPLILIAEILGVSPDRRADFKRWTDDVFTAVNGVDHIDDPTAREGRKQEIIDSSREMSAYFERVIDDRRAHPREDLVSRLVLASEHDNRLTSSEVIDLLRLLLVGGNQTTTGLMTNAVVALLGESGQWERLQAEREFIPNLVEETLRFDPPLQIVLRQATAESEIGGVAVPAGAILALLIGSANRDERRFAEPETFDPFRDATGHLAFGHGIHFCLGASLARLQARIAFEELLDAFSGLQPVTQPPYRRYESLILRSVKSLALTYPRPTAEWREPLRPEDSRAE